MIKTVPKSVALGLLALAQFGLFGLLGWVSYSQNVEEKRAFLAADARAAADHMSQTLNLVEVELSFLEEGAAKNPQWFSELDEQAVAEMRKTVDTDPHIISAAIADDQGIILGLVRENGNARAAGLDVSDRSYFTAHSGDERSGTYLSGPILGRVGNIWILVVSRRVSASDGSFLGIVTTGIDPTFFTDEFTLLNHLPIERRAVADDGSVVALAGPSVSRRDVEALRGLASDPAVYRSESGFFETQNAAGEDSLAAIARVPRWPLIATSSMTNSEILSSWWGDLLGLGIALGLTFAGLLALVLGVYRHLENSTKQERRFRGLIEEAIDGLIIHDLGMVRFSNDAAANILGLASGTELRGRSLTDFLPKEMHVDARNRWRNVKETGKPITVRQIAAHRIDGQAVYLDISSQLVDWLGKTVIRSSLSDVTEQVLVAQRDQRQAAILSAVNDAHSIYLSQTRNQAAFDQLLEKILFLSSAAHGVIIGKMQEEDGDDTVRSLAVSSMAPDQQQRQIFIDWAEGNILNTDLQDFLTELPDENAVNFLSDTRQCRAMAGALPDGFSIDNALIVPLALEDEILGQVALLNCSDGFCRDLPSELAPIIQTITGILADQRSQRLREAAERASKSKSVFLAHMSHELRTPLSGVIANLELLSGMQLNGEQAELVDASMSAGKGLLGIIGNTLDFSKIEADELFLDMVEFDPGAMLENIQSIFFAAARDKGVDLYTVVDANVPRIVVADEMRLRQVVANLVGNAIKFTPKGRIGIYLSAEKTEDFQARLRISVDDTGVGFDPAKAVDLFKPFGQEKSSTSRSFGGTGLGLTIAHRLVELHEGEISCHSRHEEGSSFVASLPARVVEWNAEDSLDLNGHCVVLLFPTGDVPDHLASGLEAVGAEVRQIKDPEAIADATLERDDKQMSLVIDWDSAAFDTAALLKRHGGDFDQILAAASRYDPDRRRQALFFRELDLVTKPITASNLSHAIYGKERGKPAPSAEQQTTAATESRVFESGRAPKILVAEDQPMNQMVLRRQLRRLGVDCDIAEHGGEALEFLEHDRYDVVITDCAMPVMDGFALSRAIREKETDGQAPCPIIALTANAVSGDAQRCYDAGMNAYLSKPASLAELANAITKVWQPADALSETLTTAEPLSNEASPKPSSETTPPINREALADLLGEDDPEMIDGLISDFFRSWQNSFAALASPLQDKDPTALREAAHAAKGTARYGMATVLADTCESLEKLAGAGELDGAEDLIKSLEAETSRLKSYLEDAGLIRDDERQSA